MPLVTPSAVALLSGVIVDGADVPGARLRSLLVPLLLAGGRPVTVSALIEAVWEDAVPAEPAGALQALISRARRTTGLRIETVPGGYRVPADAVILDVTSLDRARRAAGAAFAAGRPAEAGVLAREALAGWTEPGEHLPATESARLRGVHRDLVALTAEAALADPMADVVREEVIALVAGACAANPLDEPLSASLMRLLVADGRPTQALAHYEVVRGALVDYGGEPSGALRRAHGEALGASATRDPEPPSSPGTRSGVPLAGLGASMTGFRVAEPLLGRADDLAALVARVDHHVLVTLVGPGGVGKTSLVAALAQEWRGRGEPVHDVLLAGARSQADVMALVLAVLRGRRRPGPSESSRVIPPQAGLADVAAGARGLLVLDNAEHLLDAVADVALTVCATGAADLRVVVTSRAPLGVLGEQVQVLDPLADTDALALVARRARAVRAVGPADDVALAELCRRLDNLPLALELAAARMRTMPLADLLTALDDRFALLASGPRGLPERHRSLQSLIDWSWDLLAEPEQVLLLRLAVFPAGAPGGVVAAVCADDLLSERALVSALANLVDASLVILKAGRYLMLETVRQYADARSCAAEREAVSARLAGWAAGRSRALVPRLTTTGQREAILEVSAERASLVAALRWAAATGRSDLATSVALLLTNVAMVLGAHHEAVEWTRVVDAIPGALPPRRRLAGAPVSADVAQWREGTSLAMFGAINVMVMGHRRLLARLLARLRRALEHPHLLEPGEVQAVELVVSLARKPVSASLAAADRLAASSASRWSAWGLLAAAWLRENGGIDDLGLADARAAHALLLGTGDAAGRGAAASFIGQRLAGIGELDQAASWWAEAEEAAVSIGADADARQARLLLLRTQLQVSGAGGGDADRLIGQLADLAAAHPDDDAVRFTLATARAEKALAAGDWAGARKIYRTLTHELQGPAASIVQVQALVLAGASVVEVRAGDLGAALELLDQAVALARAASDVPIEAMVGDAVALYCAVSGADSATHRIWATSERFGAHLHAALGGPVPPQLLAVVGAPGAAATSAEATEVAELDAAEAVGTLRDVIDQALRR